jgi:hypothetical protein
VGTDPQQQLDVQRGPRPDQRQAAQHRDQQQHGQHRRRQLRDHHRPHQQPRHRRHPVPVLVDTDGTINWGPGASTVPDTNLYRSAANVLTTDDSLAVGINLSVAGSGAITGNLAVTGGITAGATTWTTYTPTVTNGGSVTWTTRTGYYYKLGKIVFVCVYLNVNAVGTGTGIVSVDMPSSVDRTFRQALTLHAETIGANGNATSSIRGGECVFFTGGTAPRATGSASTTAPRTNPTSKAQTSWPMA